MAKQQQGHTDHTDRDSKANVNVHLWLTSANDQILPSRTVEVRPNGAIVVEVCIQEWNNPVSLWGIKLWHSHDLRSLQHRYKVAHDHRVMHLPGVKCVKTWLTVTAFACFNKSLQMN